MRWMIGVLLLAGAAVVGALVWMSDSVPERDAERRAGRDRETERSQASRDPNQAGTVGSREGFGVRVQLEMPDGSPAADADLSIHGPERRHEVAASDGTVNLSGLPQGEYSLYARRDQAAADWSFEIFDRDVDLGTLRLSEGIAVRGHVYDANKKPLIGASVEAAAGEDSLRTRFEQALKDRNQPKPLAAWTSTDSDGAYQLLLPGPGTYALRASAQGYAGQGEPARLLTESAYGIDFFLLPGLEVSGTVTDEMGRPIEGAWVVAGGGRSGSDSRTDAEGRFHNTAPWGTRATLRVRATGYAPYLQRNIAPPASDLSIQLARGSTILLRLVEGEEGGPPAAGVSVALLAEGVTTVTSNESGLAEIPTVALDQIPRGRGGDVLRFFVGGGVYAPKEVELERTELIDGVMDLGTVVVEIGGVARGRVLEKGSGDPIEGAVVRFIGGLPLRSLFLNAEHAVSGPDGRYELPGIPRGAQALLALHPDFTDPRGSRDLLMSSRRAGGELLFAQGVDEIERDLHLEPASQVTGVVLKPDGEPAPGARVQRLGGRGFDHSLLSTAETETYSDAEGRFRLGGLRPRLTFELMASHREFGSSAWVAAQAGPDTSITLRMQSALELTGRVIDDQDSPIAGTRVSARPATRQRGLPTISPGLTDEEGRFTIRNVPAGELVLIFSHPAFKPANLQVSLQAGAGGTKDVGEVALTRGIGIDGQVVDESGTPQAGLSVVASFTNDKGLSGFDAGQRLQEERRFASAVTDDEGRFAMFGLMDGKYQIQVSGAEMYSDRPLVQAGTPDVILTVRRAASLEVHLVSSDGRPVTRASVSARMDETKVGARGFLAFGYTDDRGRANLYPLPPDQPFRLEISHAGYKPVREEGVTATAEPKTIRLDAGLRIAGVVVRADDTPVPGMTVSARSTAKGSPSVRTDEEGRFEIGGLESLPYQVMVGTQRTDYLPVDPITATPGAGDLRFVLTRGESILGKVTDSAGNPARQVRIRALDGTGYEAASVWVWRMDGGFELKGLPKGSYTLRFTRRVDSAEVVKVELSAVATGTDDLKVTIPD